MSIDDQLSPEMVEHFHQPPEASPTCHMRDWLFRGPDGELYLLLSHHPRCGYHWARALTPEEVAAGKRARWACTSERAHGRTYNPVRPLRPGEYLAAPLPPLPEKAEPAPALQAELPDAALEYEPAMDARHRLHFPWAGPLMVRGLR